jgi:multimeric flavodoxin WrbA
MKIVVISGSHHATSQSAKVGGYCEANIKQAGHACVLVDLAQAQLPWWQSQQQLREAPWSELSPQLVSADGVVLITPEWEGMVTPALKNFLVFAAESRTLTHKPALIVSVSDSDGGTYPVAELRMSSGKNSRLCFIPEHVIVRHVRSVLNHRSDGESADDQKIRRRLSYALSLLFEYSSALAFVRASRVFAHDEFPFGM